MSEDSLRVHHGAALTIASTSAAAATFRQRDPKQVISHLFCLLPEGAELELELEDGLELEELALELEELELGS